MIEGRTGERRFCLDGRADLSGAVGAHGYWGPITEVVDLDGDGRQDVLAGATAYRGDGTRIWDLGPENDGFASAGNLLPGNPGKEVALVTRGQLWVLDAATGIALARHRVLGGGAVIIASGCDGPTHGPRYPPFNGGPPLVVDVDGDGDGEVVLASWGLLQLIEPDTDGVIWTLDIRDVNSASTGASAADLDGDGFPEIVHADETHLRIVDARTGTVMARVANSSRTRTEFPVIGDVDGDGSAEIVVSSSNEYCHLRAHGRTTDPGVVVFGERFSRFTNVEPVWLQHTARRSRGRFAESAGPAPTGSMCP